VTPPSPAAIARAASTMAASASAPAAASAAAAPPPAITTVASAAGEAHPFGSLFSSQADVYARFRPTYPPSLYAAIEEYAAAHGNASRDLAVDIACGSGQATRDLAPRFKRVIGVDASPAQVAAAPSLASNIEFRVGTAEESHVESESADCVVAAQALHWFDVPRFYAEAARILKPRGTLAIVTYSSGHLADSAHGEAADAAADAALQHVYEDVLGPYWDPRRTLVDALYAGMDPTAPLFADVRRVPLPMSRDVSVTELLGYLQTWSGYNTFLKKEGVAKGGERDPLVALARKLVTIYGVGAAVSSGGSGGSAAGGDDDAAMAAAASRLTTRIHWPLMLIVGTKAP